MEMEMKHKNVHKKIDIVGRPIHNNDLLTKGSNEMRDRILKMASVILTKPNLLTTQRGERFFT